MTLNHGILNIPLHKRGNFHKELDDYLASEVRRKHQEFNERKASFESAKEEAKRMYELMDKDLVRAEAKRRCMKLTEFREVLKDIRDFKPKQAFVVFQSFIKSE
jgi:hypothetical protein